MCFTKERFYFTDHLYFYSRGWLYRSGAQCSASPGSCNAVKMALSRSSSSSIVSNVLLGNNNNNNNNNINKCKCRLLKTNCRYPQ